MNKYKILNLYDKISLKSRFVMAAFQEHLNITVLTSGIIIIPFHNVGLINLEQSLISLFLGILGGVAPDLDSDSSKPIQSFFKILSIFIPLIFLLSFNRSFSILEMLMIWLITSFVLKSFFFKIFLSLTHHRGIFHSIPMGILFTQLVIFFSYNFFHISSNIAFIYGVFILIGFLTHLILDEIYSVNVLGIHIKKTFGSALKLFDTNNKLGTLTLYILIVILWSILPNSKDIYQNIIEVFSHLDWYKSNFF